MVWPCHSTRPASGRVSPAMMRNVVDFPAPLGPMSAAMQPRSTMNEASSIAVAPPKSFLIDSTWSNSVPPSASSSESFDFGRTDLAPASEKS